MEKMGLKGKTLKKFFKLPVESLAGSRLAVYHARAVAAEEAAEAFAVEVGASAYIQPSEFFAGGVAFVEFDQPYTGDVWRPFVTDDTTYYDPCCTVKVGVLMLRESQEIPTDTDNVFYGGRKLTWPDVRNLDTLAHWARSIGYKLTGDAAIDWKYIDEAMTGKQFVIFNQYIGSKEAVMVERKRRALPLVDVQDFYKAVGLPGNIFYDKTPAFFIWKDYYYIYVSSGLPGLNFMTAISRKEYYEAKKKAVADMKTWLQSVEPDTAQKKPDLTSGHSDR